MERQPQHSYYPPGVSIPGWAADEAARLRHAPVFVGVIVSIASVVYRLATRRLFRPRPIDCAAAAWFSVCELSSARGHPLSTSPFSVKLTPVFLIGAFLHIVFEGYYIYHRTDIAGQQSALAQLWKEYALSDSRYLTSDVFTVCIETITVYVWGPLCLLTSAAILGDSPFRHVSQAVVCTAHLYGVALYYATSWTDYRFHGTEHSRPEFLYYWVYYIGFNLPWVIVPAVGQRLRRTREMGKAKGKGVAAQDIERPRQPHFVPHFFPSPSPTSNHDARASPLQDPWLPSLRTHPCSPNQNSSQRTAKHNRDMRVVRISHPQASSPSRLRTSLARSEWTSLGISALRMSPSPP
ncbi:hypothetical protein DCS_02930 [Drechmeria coniospora]|uniref:EXPERA domain-containing protein n=1 Tax=Drechmeria coniospora TaxID=98403 RepID=A0A151GXF9_DRECN|nr:hypothetical protein DCS_02930 [Drechmeria coniospora]KYK61786.1 hypothetical protein DCS_02930 [Drechmeria coniospora]